MKKPMFTKRLISQKPVAERKGAKADKIIEAHKKSGYRNIVTLSNQ